MNFLSNLIIISCFCIWWCRCGYLYAFLTPTAVIFCRLNLFPNRFNRRYSLILESFRASLDALENRKLVCPCKKSNHISSVHQPEEYSLHRLSYSVPRTYLALSCLPVCKNSAHTGRILMKFEYFSEFCRENSSFVRI
jgi:hypothetical protein